MTIEDLQTPTLPLDPLLYRQGIQVIRAINHKSRHLILQLIHLKGRITVTEIDKTLNLGQTVTSQQLAILRNSGYVKTKREGKLIYYTIDYKMLIEANRLIKELVCLK